MKYQHISGLEEDQRRRILKGVQFAKRRKDLQELHAYKEKMRKGAEQMSKINELRRIGGDLAHLQPGARLAHIQNQPHMVKAREGISHTWSKLGRNCWPALV